MKKFFDNVLDKAIPFEPEKTNQVFNLIFVFSK